MTYAGSFNSYTFGTGARPGASVASLFGWRTKRARIDVAEGGMRPFAGPPSPSALQPTLTLNLHAATGSELDDEIDRALAAFVPTADPLPLVIAGRARWVQVAEVDPVLAPDWPGEEKSTTLTVSFVAADPTLYSSAQTTAQTISSPTASSSFEAANAGAEVPDALRAWEFSMTAATTVTNPRVRVDHQGSPFEQVTFSGLTVAVGQTLTIVDLVPRVGSRLVSGYVRSLTEAGTTGRSPRWWRLLPSTGTDDANEVTMSCATGTFTGSCKVRSTW